MNFERRSLRVAAALLAWGLLATPALAQEVYKWTDANGTVHYDQQPPPQGAQRVQLRGGVSTTVAAAPKSPVAYAKEADEMDAMQRARLCETAQRNLQAIDSGSMVVGGGDITKATRLSEDERLKSRGEAQAQIGNYCHE